MGKIYIIDVTNRDGVQTARLGLSKVAKTMINMHLNEMGVYQSEFGFPTTRHESHYLRANLKLQEMGILQPIHLGGWIRATTEDVERAFKLVPEIKNLNLSISTSSQMIRALRDTPLTLPVRLITGMLGWFACPGSPAPPSRLAWQRSSSFSGSMILNLTGSEEIFTGSSTSEVPAKAEGSAARSEINGDLKAIE